MSDNCCQTGNPGRTTVPRRRDAGSERGILSFGPMITLKRRRNLILGWMRREIIGFNVIT